MECDCFIGLVQDRAHLASADDAMRAIRATLETLAERIDVNEVRHLAALLPEGIGCFLLQNAGPERQRFTFGEFSQRVALREEREPAKAIFHARCVVEVLEETVAAGELREVREQLPEEFVPLFEAGHIGHMNVSRR